MPDAVLRSAVRRNADCAGVGILPREPLAAGSMGSRHLYRRACGIPEEEVSNNINLSQFFDDLICYLAGQENLAGYEVEQAQSAKREVVALVEALDGLEQAYCRAGSPLNRLERTQDRKRLIAARAAMARANGESA